jgi:opacity protein-like surface antigen
MRKPTAAAVFVWAALGCGVAAAQSLEVTPFGGYRFGGGFYEIASGQSVDTDGAGSFGIVLDIPYRDTLQIEGFFTHQEARFTVPAPLDGQPTRLDVTVQHFQVGGLRELESDAVRPFLTGTLGLTRYASGGDNEVRFSLAAGGGVKMSPTDHLGLRLDGRLFVTFVDAELDSLACAPGAGVCVGSLDAWAVWQAEFSAGLIIRF